MEMTIEEIRYRLQAMTTMCTFQDAVGHDLSQKEIKLYNQAKDEAIKIMRKYQKIEQIVNGNINGAYSNVAEIRRIINGNDN